MYFWYEPFYRLEFGLPRGWGDPFARREGKSGPRRAYALVRARYLVSGSPDDPRPPIYFDGSGEQGVGVPLGKLDVWDPAAAKLKGIVSHDFRLTCEEARTAGSRYAVGLARGRNLTEDSVSLRQVHRVMAPTHQIVQATVSGYRTVTAVYLKSPIVLERGTVWQAEMEPGRAVVGGRRRPRAHH